MSLPLTVRLHWSTQLECYTLVGKKSNWESGLSKSTLVLGMRSFLGKCLKISIHLVKERKLGDLKICWIVCSKFAGYKTVYDTAGCSEMDETCTTKLRFCHKGDGFGGFWAFLLSTVDCSTIFTLLIMDWTLKWRCFTYGYRHLVKKWCCWTGMICSSQHSKLPLKPYGLFDIQHTCFAICFICIENVWEAWLGAARGSCIAHLQKRAEAPSLHHAPSVLARKIWH